MEKAGAKSLAFGPGGTHPSLCFSASAPRMKGLGFWQASPADAMCCFALPEIV